MSFTLKGAAAEAWSPVSTGLGCGAEDAADGCLQVPRDPVGKADTIKDVALLTFAG